MIWFPLVVAIPFPRLLRDFSVIVDGSCMILFDAPSLARYSSTLY